MASAFSTPLRSATSRPCATCSPRTWPPWMTAVPTAARRYTLRHASGRWKWRGCSSAAAPIRMPSLSTTSASRPCTAPWWPSIATRPHSCWLSGRRRTRSSSAAGQRFTRPLAMETSRSSTFCCYAAPTHPEPATTGTPPSISRRRTATGHSPTFCAWPPPSARPLQFFRRKWAPAPGRVRGRRGVGGARQNERAKRGFCRPEPAPRRPIHSEACGLALQPQPARQLPSESSQRKRAVAEHSIVEGADVEGSPEPGGCLGPKSLDLALAHLVCQCLGGQADVAVGLDSGFRLRQAGFEERLNGSLARPAEGMNSGVHDKPRRPVGLAIQHPETLGGVEEEAHLVGKTLRVKTPAFHVGHPRHPRAQPPEDVEARVFGLKGNLEVMSGHSLVEAHAGEANIAAAGQVVGVDVIDAGPAAIHRRRVVVGRGRVRFLERFHGPHLAGGLGQMAEIGRRSGKRPLDLTASVIQQFLARPWRCTRARLQGRPSGFRVITKANLAGSRAPLVLDLGHFLESVPMQLPVFYVQRCPVSYLLLVLLFSFGRRPQSRFHPRGLAVPAQQRLEKGLIRRPDVLSHRLDEPTTVGRRRHLHHP